MTISIQRLGETAVELHPRGVLDSDDYARVLPLLEDMIEKHGSIGLLVRVSDMRGWTPVALWKDLAFDIKHYRDVSRLALVARDADPTWLAALSRPFTAAEVRAFDGAHIAEAREWVQTRPERFVLASDAFAPESEIPRRHVRDGDDVSPPLRWSGAPPGTRAYALVVDDPDAPSGTFTHWVAYNIPVTDRGLPAGVEHRGDLTDGTMQGRNDFGEIGYAGPQPPPGSRHRYVFKLFALDEPLPLEPGVSPREVERSMQGHVLAETQLTGHYATGV